MSTFGEPVVTSTSDRGPMVCRPFDQTGHFKMSEQNEKILVLISKGWNDFISNELNTVPVCYNYERHLSYIDRAVL